MKFSVAPMMDWTDRHCRVFHRQLTRHALLYTEMVTADAILHGKREQLLAFDPSEHPVALQLGGSDPRKLRDAAAIGAGYGYDEINLNVGCPSDRVQEGRFGACLMAEPDLVARCTEAMARAVSIPVTIKCRIGIDDQDAEEDFDRFVRTLANAGVKSFVVHARKAWLKGLSPKENREVPPLDYERVARLKARYPNLFITLNGGLADVLTAHREVRNHQLDGAMIGRAAYQTPYTLADVDRVFYGCDQPQLSRLEVLDRMTPYIERHLARGGRLNNIVRHILGLYHGQPGARTFRRILSENAVRPHATIDVLTEARRAVAREVEAA